MISVSSSMIPSLSVVVGVVGAVDETEVESNVVVVGTSSASMSTI